MTKDRVDPTNRKLLYLSLLLFVIGMWFGVPRGLDWLCIVAGALGALIAFHEIGRDAQKRDGK